MRAKLELRFFKDTLQTTNKYADTHNIDLTISGPPVRTGLDRLLIGNVSDKSIQNEYSSNFSRER
jgi:nucleotide-binding universal stress UspA family protein